VHDDRGLGIRREVGDVQGDFAVGSAPAAGNGGATMLLRRPRVEADPRPAGRGAVERVTISPVSPGGSSRSSSSKIFTSTPVRAVPQVSRLSFSI